MVTILLLALMTGVHCTSAPPLTEDEMEKLDPALQRLVERDGATDGPFDYVMSTREDGTRIFAVIIRTDDPDALREAGIPLASVFGEIVTARLSLQEIKQAARMDEVNAIRNSEQDLIPQPPSESAS